MLQIPEELKPTEGSIIRAGDNQSLICKYFRDNITIEPDTCVHEFFMSHVCLRRPEYVKLPHNDELFASFYQYQLLKKTPLSIVLQILRGELESDLQIALGFGNHAALVDAFSQQYEELIELLVDSYSDTGLQNAFFALGKRTSNVNFGDTTHHFLRQSKVTFAKRSLYDIAGELLSCVAANQVIALSALIADVDEHKLSRLLKFIDHRALREACCLGFKEIAILLLQHYDKNQILPAIRSQQGKVLIEASRHGMLAFLELALHNVSNTIFAEIQCSMSRPHLPLFLACEQGDCALIDFLLSRYPSESVVPVLSAEHYYPFVAAAETKRIEAVELLLAKLDAQALKELLPFDNHLLLRIAYHEHCDEFICLLKNLYHSAGIEVPSRKALCVKSCVMM